MLFRSVLADPTDDAQPLVVHPNGAVGGLRCCRGANAEAITVGVVEGDEPAVREGQVSAARTAAVGALLDAPAKVG